MPEPATKHVDGNKPSEPAGNSDSHVAGNVLKDNRSAGGFCLPIIGGQFEFDQGTFKQEKKQPVKAKGDGFNTSVASVASRYAKQAITEKIASSATNWSLSIAQNILDYTPLVKLELPGGQLTLGMDMGVESIKFKNEDDNKIVAEAKMKTAGEVAAKASLATGSNTKVADWQVRGDVNGSASFSLGEVGTKLTISLKPQDNVIGRSVESYKLDVDINPKLSIDLEGSLSFRMAYLMQKLKQDWAVLFVKGLHFGAEGGVTGSIEGHGTALPAFSLKTGKAWKFTTASAIEPVKDPFPLKPTSLPKALDDSKELLAKEEELFGPRKDKPKEKHEAHPKEELGDKLKQFQGSIEQYAESEKENDKDDDSYLNWALSYIKKAGKQTALTTLKDKLATNGSLLEKYTKKISDEMKGKRMKLGDYLSITVEELSLAPESGLTFRVSQSVNLFGSWLTSKGTIELQYDLFHQHAYHFQYDLQGKDVLPKLAPLWRMHSTGISMSAAGQSLTLKGLDLTSDELIVNQGQLALKLPKALGGTAFTIHAKGLKFGKTVSWQLLGGETKNSINMFGQKHLVIEKLAIGSGDHEDGRKGIVFVTTDLKIDLFNKKRQTQVHVVWDIDKGQFVGKLSNPDVDGVKITDLILSDRGMHIQDLKLSLSDIINSLPGKDVLPDSNLEVDIKGFKISSAGLTITDATARLPSIKAGPLSISGGALGISVENSKATGFHVKGKAELELWGANASAEGSLAYKNGEIDKEKTNFAGKLDLGLIKAEVGNIHFLKDGNIEIDHPSMTINPGAITEIPTVGKIVPSWLSKGLKNTELIFSADKYSSADHKFTKPKFIPVKFPIPLGGGKNAIFHYDKKNGQVTLELPKIDKHWDVASAHLNVPLLYGFAGLEVGGEIGFGVGLGDGNNLKLTYNTSKEVPALDVDGSIMLRLSADATIKVGVYAGVPKLIQISGGVYAQLSVANALKVSADGRIPLGGTENWFMHLGTKATAELAGQGGAYIAYTIVGLRGEKKFPLVDKELAKWAYVGDITIGKTPEAKGSNTGSLTENKALKNEGTESAEKIKSKLDSLHSNIDLQSADVHKRTVKADDTVELHEATKTSSKSEVDKLMDVKTNNFSQAIAKENKQPKPDLAKIAILEAQKEVWSKWHPGKIQLTGSRKDRTANNLARRRQDLYTATMKLMFDKTVSLRSLINQQLTATQQSLDLLEQELKQLQQQDKSNERDQKITLVEHEIASYELMLNRLEVIVKQPLPKNHWQSDISEQQHAHLKAAVKDNGGLLVSAKAQLKEAQIQYEVANNKLVSIAKARQVYREQIGAENISSVDELEKVQELMNQDHAKWYSERNSFWRKMFGKSQDSIVGEAMSKLREAELKLGFAQQQLEYTEKLAEG